MRRYIRFILIIIVILISFSCKSNHNGELPKKKDSLTVNISLLTIIDESKALFVSENLINNINIYLFNEQGKLITFRYIDNLSSSFLPLVIWNEKSGYFYAIANIGRRYYVTMKEIEDGRHQLSSPSELSSPSGAVLMSGKTDLIALYNNADIPIPLKRACSRIELQLNKSYFTGSEFNVTKITMKNVPKGVMLFKENRPTLNEEIFREGDSREGDQLLGLESGYLAFYCYENMQGTLLPENNDLLQKVLTGHPAETVSTYIEIIANYRSEVSHGSIIYRFYPGRNNHSNFDIARNTAYTITFFPVGDGRGYPNWRIDENNLKDYVSKITLTPNSITFNKLGEIVIVTPTILPLSAFDKRVSWSSSNPIVAHVDDSGRVTSLSEGETIITASAVDGSGTSTSIPCIVESELPSATINVTNYIAFRGEEFHLSLSDIRPSGGLVTWSSSSSGVASVTPTTSNSASVEGRIIGDAVIYAMVNGKVVASCNITVVPLIVTFSNNNIKTFQGFNDTIVYSVSPPQASSLKLLWEKENPSDSYSYFPYPDNPNIIRGGDDFHLSWLSSEIRVSFVDYPSAGFFSFYHTNYPAITVEKEINLVWGVETMIPLSERKYYDALSSKRPASFNHPSAYLFFENIIDTGLRPEILASGEIIAQNYFGDFPMNACTYGDDGILYKEPLNIRIHQIINVYQHFIFTNIIYQDSINSHCQYSRERRYALHPNNSIIRPTDNYLISGEENYYEVPYDPLNYETLCTDSGILYVSLNDYLTIINPIYSAIISPLYGALKITEHYRRVILNNSQIIPVYIISTDKWH